MGALTPSFVMDFESNMKILTESSYNAFSSNLWWSRFMKSRPTQSRRELVTWLLSTAKIESVNKFGGEMKFDDLVSTYTTYEMGAAVAGLKLRRFQLEDLDGGGLDLAGKWSQDIGAYMAYWPQKQLVNLIKTGHLSTALGYDGLPFFSASHPVNPGDTSLGTYSNLLTGGSAAPIDDTVTVDVALANLSKVISAVRTVKMPNGEDPRFLRPTAIVCSPRMQARVTQLTNAKFVAQAAASGGGSGDVEKLIASYGFDVPVIADELAGFESDTTWFLACEEMAASTQIGPFVYIDREPFKINYYSGATGGSTGLDAVLDRADELEWHCKGRNVAAYGHPYMFFKIKAT